MSDEQRLREIREREAAATPGPWHVTDHISPHMSVYSSERNITGPIYKDMNGICQANSDFIAASRTDVTWLLAYAERKIAERDAEIKTLRTALLDVMKERADLRAEIAELKAKRRQRQ